MLLHVMHLLTDMMTNSDRHKLANASSCLSFPRMKLDAMSCTDARLSCPPHLIMGAFRVQWQQEYAARAVTITHTRNPWMASSRRQYCHVVENKDQKRFQWPPFTIGIKYCRPTACRWRPSVLLSTDTCTHMTEPLTLPRPASNNVNPCCSLSGCDREHYSLNTYQKMLLFCIEICTAQTLRCPRVYKVG